MTAFQFKVGDLVVNGCGTLGEVVELVERDPRWQRPGYRVLRLNRGDGDGYGFTQFWPSDNSAMLAPTEWAPVIGGKLQQRWVYHPGENRWDRQLRRAGAAVA